MTRTRTVAAAVALLIAAPAAAAKKPLPTGERIDVNRASVVELMRLPGVGRVRAEAIAARRAHAPFGKLEDLLAIRGLSQGWLEKNRTHLTAGGAPAPSPSRPLPLVPKRGPSVPDHGPDRS